MPPDVAWHIRCSGTRRGDTPEAHKQHPVAHPIRHVLCGAACPTYPLSMPLYEYICEADGSVIELIRPMKDADVPPPDPDGRGRRFVRKISTFAAKSSGGSSAPFGAGSAPAGGGCCPCGKPGGGGGGCGGGRM